MAKVKEVPQIVFDLAKLAVKGNKKELNYRLKKSAFYFLERLLTRNCIFRYYLWQTSAYFAEHHPEKESSILVVYFWEGDFNEKSYLKLQENLEQQEYKNYKLVKAYSLSNIDLQDFEYVSFVEQGDVLAVSALKSIANTIEIKNPEVIYSDEDVINFLGIREKPFFKPQYSPMLHLSQNYLSAFLVLKNTTEVLQFLQAKLLNQRALYGFLLDYMDKDKKAERIAEVLYHRNYKNKKRIEKTSTKDIVQRFIEKKDYNAKILYYKQAKSINQVKFLHKEMPKVSIIIPFRDKLKLLQKCLKSIAKKTTYSNYEIILVDNRSTSKEMLKFLENTEHKLIKADFDFNYSRLNNIAVEQATGEYLVFLNNDTAVISTDWIENMLALAQLDQVGAVGAKLFYWNGMIQHAGSIGARAHAGRFSFGFDSGNNHYYNIIREYSGVTAACLMVSRQKFDEIGGFNEDLVVECNDHELCFKLLDKGYTNLYCPHSKLFHYESMSRKSNSKSEYYSQRKLFEEKYFNIMCADPYYNPNLSWKRDDFAISLWIMI